MRRLIFIFSLAGLTLGLVDSKAQTAASAEGVTIKAQKLAYGADEPIAVEYSNPKVHVRDWITIARAEEGSVSAINLDIGERNPWSKAPGTQASGTIQFGGLAKGKYEARYISWDGGNNRIVVRFPFVVGDVPPPPGDEPTVPSKPAAPDPGSQRSLTIQVPANQAWTPTGVMLDGGTSVRIEASAMIEASGQSDARVFYHQVPPEGRDEFLSNMPQPLLKSLCLMAKVGNGGPALPVGKYIHTFSGGAPYGNGELYLGINDDTLADNSGAWNVRITVLGAAMPSARASPADLEVFAKSAPVSDVPSEEALSRVVPNDSFAGKWDTTWGEMTLTQTGDRVTGTYTHPWHNGTIDGTVKDRVLRFNWTQNNRSPGTGRFTLSADGQTFSGEYNNKSDPDAPADGQWTGKRK